MKDRTPTDAPTVVCLVDRRRNPLSRVIRNAGFTVIDSFTPDQVVAVCVNNRIDCVVLDQDFFVEVDGWSVAQSLKLVRRSLCVLLVSRATRLHDRLPKDVDAMVSQDQPQQVINMLRQLLHIPVRPRRRRAAAT